MRALTFLAVMAVLIVPVAIQHWHFRRAARRSIPAAPDNQPGTDARLLAACQHIANPDTRREDTP
ncbi:hypothetical protein ACH4F6_31695 [Streptomyces sp. NPDC017936]|uniref:hypothetical protein n=1 Tax=Streptomyces sp. NPDC017936 TaxID=3365016 RepID=UPI0037B7C32E